MFAPEDGHRQSSLIGQVPEDEKSGVIQFVLDDVRLNDLIYAIREKDSAWRNGG